MEPGGAVNRPRVSVSCRDPELQGNSSSSKWDEFVEPSHCIYELNEDAQAVHSPAVDPTSAFAKEQMPLQAVENTAFLAVHKQASAMTDCTQPAPPAALTSAASKVTFTAQQRPSPPSARRKQSAWSEFCLRESADMQPMPLHALAADMQVQDQQIKTLPATWSNKDQAAVVQLSAQPFTPKPKQLPHDGVTGTSSGHVRPIVLSSAQPQGHSLRTDGDLSNQPVQVLPERQQHSKPFAVPSSKQGFKPPALVGTPQAGTVQGQLVVQKQQQRPTSARNEPVAPLLAFFGSGSGPPQRHAAVPTSFASLQAYKQVWSQAITEEISIRSASNVAFDQ